MSRQEERNVVGGEGACARRLVYGDRGRWAVVVRVDSNCGRWADDDHRRLAVTGRHGDGGSWRLARAAAGMAEGASVLGEWC
jgi:hypothetical protein